MNDKSKRLKIAYLTVEDPRNKRSWSGSTYYMAQALQKHCGDVHYLGPIRVIENRIGSALNKSIRFLFKKQIAYDRLFFVAKKHAKVAVQRLAEQPFDVIFAPLGTPEVAFLEKTDIPIVIAEDATFHLIHNYLPQYSRLLQRSAYEAYAIQDRAYKTAHALFFPSEWAARSAIEDVHVEQQKVHIVPHGANFEQIPPKSIAQARKKSDRCRLLFVGLGWERKGGDIAFETLLYLEEMGIQAELVVCGCIPPRKVVHERMTVIPYLDKSDDTQRKELENLYVSADFLLVPTRRDCYGLVFCEASAFGLPSIATNTGGVTEIIKDGVNGFTLPYDARGADYARLIAEIYSNDQRYACLVKSSRASFEDRLNWDAWGITAKKILMDIVAGKTEEVLAGRGSR